MQQDDLKPLDVIHSKSALSMCSNQSNSTVKIRNRKAKRSRQRSQRLERGEHLDYLYGRIMKLWKHFLCDPILDLRENACGHSEYIPNDAPVERWRQFREKAEDNRGETLVSTQDSLPRASKRQQVVQQDKTRQTRLPN